MNYSKVIYTTATGVLCLVLMQIITTYVLIRGRYENLIRNYQVVLREETELPSSQSVQVTEGLQLFPEFSFWKKYPSWKEDAVVVKNVAGISQRFLTMGIVTAKRPNNTIYIFDTLDSLLENAKPEEKNYLYIVVMLAENDEIWKRNITSTIKKRYSNETSSGIIQIIQGFPGMYPELNNLTHHYSFHPKIRVTWKAKQNIDFVFLWLYVYGNTMSQYYLHLEDDVVTLEGYINIINDYIKSQTDQWVCLEYSELGMIAKLYHTQDLESLSKLVALYYEEQPADFTYLNFNSQMLQFGRRIKKPTIFQHIGRTSSLPGKIMMVQDRFFSKKINIKKLKGDNPPADMSTSLKIYPGFDLENAYFQGFGFFWSSSSPRKGDFVLIKFKKPQNVTRIVVLSGVLEIPTDAFNDAVVETSSHVNTTGQCVNYQPRGNFIKGKADVTINRIADTNSSTPSIDCVKIRAVKQHKHWVIIEEIAVFIQ